MKELINVAIVVGTRPEVIKMASVIEMCRRTDGLATTLVHTGQHYDWNMSASFVRELNLPKPDFFLNVGSGVEQFGKVVLEATKLFSKFSPDILLVEGDTNSAAGVALAASKVSMPIGHVEAGCRSFNRLMQEEINRMVIADCADYHFAPTSTCRRNLLREGVPSESIFLTGHPIVQTVRQMMPKVNDSTIAWELGLEKPYVLFTLHRSETVDNRTLLRRVIDSLKVIPAHIVFPVHPRTRQCLRKFGLYRRIRRMGVKMIPPCGYVSSLRLIMDSSLVLTDSGGIQQECALLGTPCVTLRTSTEWVETVRTGVNFLASPLSNNLGSIIGRVYEKLPEIQARFAGLNLFGDERASARIVRIIINSVGRD